jgi:hypothetical protein
MGAGARALTAFEIAVGGAHDPLIGKTIVTEVPAVATAGLVPFEARLAKYTVYAFGFRSLADRCGTRDAHRLDPAWNATTAQDASGLPQV